jgi:hypothetical protein
MDTLRTHNPEFWLAEIFSAKAVLNGGVVRRARRWVETEIGMELFERSVRARGFHLIEAGTQLVVICHSGPVYMRF